MTLENAIKNGSQILKSNSIASHQLDAQIILSDIMGVTKEFLIINNNIKISQKVATKYYSAIKRRVNREPVAYILGKKEFWSKDFIVNYSTLVPRPETEILIYYLVDYYKNKKINILDIGTGSGCILLSLLKELSNSNGIGIDISAKAIYTAKINSKRLNLSFRSKFKVFNINKFLIGKYDLIVSNPPYIPSKDIKNLSRDILSYEPLAALKGGIDGLDVIKKVVYKSKSLLKQNGLLAIEIGTNQYLKVYSFLRKHGFRELAKKYDCNHNVRCIISTKV